MLWEWAHALSPTSHWSSTYQVRKERWGSWDRIGPAPFHCRLV